LVKIVDLETRLRSLAEKREDEQEDKRKANKAAAHVPECSRDLRKERPGMCAGRKYEEAAAGRLFVGEPNNYSGFKVRSSSEIT
jgi:hypothetical protein